MKRIVILLWACLMVLAVSAQKKEKVSKEETIEYLNQKAKEAIGHEKISIAQAIFVNKKTVTDAYLKRTASGVELYVNFHSPNASSYTYTAFNPKHIISITNTSRQKLTLESPVGVLEIKFIGRTALYNNNGDTTTVDRTNFHFLQTDADNQKRIEKALLHLRDIFKTEDNTFGD